MDEKTVKEIVLKTAIVPEDKDIATFIEENISDEWQDPIYVLAYKHNEIQIGMVQGQKLTIDRADELKSKYLKELRVFCKHGELYIWKQGQKLRYRLRVDREDKEGQVKIYPEKHFMWGKDIKDANNPIYEEGRGMELVWPFPVDEDQLPLKYEVWNYYTYDCNKDPERGTGLIQFYDARLVRFLDNKGKPLPNP